jgi:hypothetical protein
MKAFGASTCPGGGDVTRILEGNNPKIERGFFASGWRHLNKLVSDRCSGSGEKCAHKPTE